MWQVISTFLISLSSKYFPVRGPETGERSLEPQGAGGARSQLLITPDHDVISISGLRQCSADRKSSRKQSRTLFENDFIREL